MNPRHMIEETHRSIIFKLQRNWTMIEATINDICIFRGHMVVLGAPKSSGRAEIVILGAPRDP